MDIFGKTNLYDMFEENFIFRNLNIADKNLPQLWRI